MSGKLPDELFFDLVKSEEIEAAHELELLGYPADEAGSLEGFKARQAQAPGLFFGAYLPRPPPSEGQRDARDGRQLIGFVCATLAASQTLTHESMSRHDPSGTSVCIHSVCVGEPYRRNGVAVALLKEYISRLEADNSVERILLIVHEELRSLYEKAGFEWVGPSPVVWGSRPWFEMRRVLRGDGSTAPASASRPTAPEPVSLPPNILDLLRAPRSRHSSRPFLSFTSIDELLEADPEQGADARVNKYDLLCPREGCSSVIVKGGVASWVEREAVELEPAQSRPPLLPALPPPPEKVQCWLIRPNPMAFENVGFSKPVASSQSSNGPPLKLLTCADCELGPLGWCVQGGSDFWLAVDRVGYRAQA